ncbi:unnamed protein product [Jaminaea pallidilutea]
MASSSTSLKQQHDTLLKAFSSSTPSTDLKAIGTQLTKLKIALTQSNLLVPSTSKSPAPSTEDLTLARDVLEVGAFWSIRSKDVASFDRYMDLLRVFYNDLSAKLPPSENRPPLLGLSLLRLLSSNAIASFHTVLETLPADLLDSPYLQHPINLERWLMEGSYSKVWRSRDQVPRDEYRFFVDGLMGTIRREIASCEEKAYDSLPLGDVATLLFFSNLEEVSSMANERGWQINPSTQTVHFNNAQQGTRTQLGAAPTTPALSSSSSSGANANVVDEDLIPKRALITSNLGFVRELESIV